MTSEEKTALSEALYALADDARKRAVVALKSDNTPDDGWWTGRANALAQIADAVATSDEASWFSWKAWAEALKAER